MRSHKHQRTTRQGRGLTTRVLALGATLAIIVGGVLTYEGIHNSPKAQIHRLTVKDHQRAIKLANTKLTTPTHTSVPWNPTLRNEVATISIPAPILAESRTIGALTTPLRCP